MKSHVFKRFAALAALCALAAALGAAPAAAQALSLRAPAIVNVDGVFTARFGVAVEALPVLKGELEDGAKLELTCEVLLREAYEYWPDRELASAEFVSRLSFEPLTKHFVMTLPGRSADLRDTDLAALLRKGWDRIETPLGPWDMLEHGTDYRLVLETTMRDADAPDGISRYVYFWAWDTGNSSTFQLNFTY